MATARRDHVAHAQAGLALEAPHLGDGLLGIDGVDDDEAARARRGVEESKDEAAVVALEDVLREPRAVAGRDDPEPIRDLAGLSDGLEVEPERRLRRRRCLRLRHRHGAAPRER